MPTPPQEMPDVQLSEIPRSYSPSVETQVRPEDFGAGVGQAVEGIGHEMAQRELDQINLTNYANVMAANNERDQSQVQALHDPKTGVLAQDSGNQAPQLVDKALSDDQKHASQIRAGLTNPAQQQMFDRHEEARQGELKRTLFQYENQQMKRFASEQFDAAMKQSPINVANKCINPANQFDQAAVKEQEQRDEALIRDRGKALGLPQNAIDLQIENAHSDTVTTVMGRLLSDRRDQDAEAYFNTNSAAIVDERQRNSLQRAVNTLVTQNGALKRVNAASVDENGVPREEADVVNALRSDPWVMNDAEHMRQTFEYLDMRRGEDAKLQKDVQDEAFSQGYKQVEGGLPPDLSLMSKMGPDNWTKLEQHAAWLATQFKKDEPHKESVYRARERWLSDPDTNMNDIRDFKVEQLVGDVNTAGRDHLTALQKERLQKEGGGSGVAEARMAHEVADDDIKQMFPGKDTAKLLGDDKARADLYRNTAVRLVEQQNHLRQARGEKPLDDEGVRQFTSTLRLPIEGDPKGRQVWEAEAETLGKETGPLVTPKQMGEWQTRLVPLNEKDFSAAVDELKAGLSGKSAYGYQHDVMMTRAEQVYQNQIVDSDAYKAVVKAYHDANPNAPMPDRDFIIDAWRNYKLKEANTPQTKEYNARQAAQRAAAAQESYAPPAMTPEIIKKRWEGAGLDLRPEVSDALSTIFSLAPDVFAWAKDLLLKKRFE